MTQENKGGEGVGTTRWQLVNAAVQRACETIEEYHQGEPLRVGELVLVGVGVAEVAVEYALQDVDEEASEIMRATAVMTLGDRLGGVSPGGTVEEGGEHA